MTKNINGLDDEGNTTNDVVPIYKEKRARKPTIKCDDFITIPRQSITE